MPARMTIDGRVARSRQSLSFELLIVNSTTGKSAPLDIAQSADSQNGGLCPDSIGPH